MIRSLRLQHLEFRESSHLLNLFYFGKCVSDYIHLCLLLQLLGVYEGFAVKYCLHLHPRLVEYFILLYHATCILPYVTFLMH